MKRSTFTLNFQLIAHLDQVRLCDMHPAVVPRDVDTDRGAARGGAVTDDAPAFNNHLRPVTCGAS